MRYRTLCLLLITVWANWFLSAPLRAQSNSDPDFTNVNDILHGNRTLLNVTDLEVVYLDPNVGPVFTQIDTSNSNQTSRHPFNWNLKGLNEEPGLTPLNWSPHMFNQPSAITITELHGFNGSNLSLWLQNIASPGGASVWTPPLSPGEDCGPAFGAAADFTLDGYDDLALVCLVSGRILVVSPNDPNPLAQPFQGSFRSGSTPAVNVPPAYPTIYPVAITAGDFNGDGRQELAVLSAGNLVPGPGTAQLDIYTVDPNSLAITHASSLALTVPNGQPYLDVGSIARGRFNTTSHDQLVVAFGNFSGSPTIATIGFVANSLTPIQMSSTTVPAIIGSESGLENVQVATGKFASTNGNQYDQVVFDMANTSDQGAFFEVLSVNPLDFTLTTHSVINYQTSCAASLHVGNFDHQQADPLNPGKSEYDPNSQIALLSCNGGNSSTLSLYSVDPQSFDVKSTPDSSLALSINAQGASFVPTDLQGRSMVLGAPTKLTIENTGPTVINALPPMHIDYITPVGGTKPEVLNLSYIPDGFNSSFTLSQQSTTGGSATHTLSWSAGVDVSSSVAYQIGDPDKGIGSRLSAGFDAATKFTGSGDNSTVNYSTSKFDASKIAKTADVVIYDDSRLNIWVYPVIGQTACPAAIPGCTPDQQKPLTIQFSGPDQIDTGSISGDLLSASWYQPPWEWGNVLSYPATHDQLALIYPDLVNDPSNQLQLSTGLTFDTDNSSTEIQDTWSSNSEQGSTSSFANTTSFDVTMSAVAAVGVPETVNAKASTSVSLSGSVGLSKLQTNSAKINASNGIDIQAVGKFLDPGNYAYEVKPYILGNFPPSGVSSPYQQPAANIQTFGPLKTAFTANPVSTGAWWVGGPYSSAPDISLNHPSRWILTTPTIAGNLPSNCRNSGKGSGVLNCADIAPYFDDNQAPLNPWNSEFLAMRGFFITRADKPGVGPQLGFATAGDQLDLGVRVYNYSLAAMPGGTAVHVRFYAMPWDNVNNVQAGDSLLVGETITDPVPPFDPSSTDLNWRVVHAPSPFDTTPYAGKSFAFWVVVWMQTGNNLVQEIPGHGLTAIPDKLTKPSDVPLEMATATDGKTRVSYSNNVGFYHYAFPVLSATTGLGAPPTNNPDDVTLERVSAAKKRIAPGELDEITAVLKAGEETTRSKVYFYDGKPDSDGTLIGIETAWLEPNATTQVRIPYHAASDGVHRIWAIINKGKPHQTERHTSAIIIGRAMEHRDRLDKDDR